MRFFYFIYHSILNIGCLYIIYIKVFINILANLRLFQDRFLLILSLYQSSKFWSFLSSITFLFYHFLYCFQPLSFILPLSFIFISLHCLVLLNADLWLDLFDELNVFLVSHSTLFGPLEKNAVCFQLFYLCWIYYCYRK